MMDRQTHRHASHGETKGRPRRGPGRHVATVLGPATLILAGAHVTALRAQVPATTDSTLPPASVVHDSGLSMPCAALPLTVHPPLGPADSGTYLYELVPEVSNDIRSAIDRSVAHMNFIIRPIARRRLIKANRLFPSLTFVIRADSIGVTFAGMNPIVTPRDGGAAPWVRGETGEHYDVYMSQDGDSLRQVIATDDGQRENDFVFFDDGARIELHVTLSADRLPTPLRYTLIFRRIPGDRERNGAQADLPSNGVGP